MAVTEAHGLIPRYIPESEHHSVTSDSLQSHGLYSPWNSPGQDNRVGVLSLLQGIFPTQESNQGLMCCRQILYQLSYQGSPQGRCYIDKEGKLFPFGFPASDLC